MLRKSLFGVLVILMVASLALTACNGGGKATTEPSAPKVFIFGRGADSVQLDPAIVTDGESFRVTGQILEAALSV